MQTSVTHWDGPKSAWSIGCLKDMSSKKKWDCYSPLARLSILSNGDVLPCCNFFGRNIPIDNIKNNNIKTIWNSKKLSNIRKGIINDTLKNCSICQRIG
jgi:radical SAM protein with 4Fe4S-binding SPASM domain